MQCRAFARFGAQIERLEVDDFLLCWQCLHTVTWSWKESARPELVPPGAAVIVIRLSGRYQEGCSWWPTCPFSAWWSGVQLYFFFQISTFFHVIPPLRLVKSQFPYVAAQTEPMGPSPLFEALCEQPLWGWANGFTSPALLLAWL